jgi:hypothetical protein
MMTDLMHAKLTQLVGREIPNESPIRLTHQERRLVTRGLLGMTEEDPRPTLFGVQMTSWGGVPIEVVD